jgi:hypothetical protein
VKKFQRKTYTPQPFTKPNGRPTKFLQSLRARAFEKVSDMIYKSDLDLWTAQMERAQGKTDRFLRLHFKYFKSK